MTLEDFFREVPKAALAFSGGTDSAFLMWAAKHYGCDVKAYYVSTVFQPEFEKRDAIRLAGELNVPLRIVKKDILAVPEAAANGPRRCYYCKRAIFTALWEAAGADGYPVLLDGTNASDDAGDRPGMQALASLKCGPRSGSVEFRKRRSGVGRKRRGCSHGRNRHTPVWQRGLLRERGLQRQIWNGRKGLRFCLRIWASGISGCGSSEREHGYRRRRNSFPLCWRKERRSRER